MEIGNDHIIFQAVLCGSTCMRRVIVDSVSDSVHTSWVRNKLTATSRGEPVDNQGLPTERRAL